jgi:hypothetical protein
LQNAHVLRLVESTSSLRTESRVHKQKVEEKKEETTRMRINQRESRPYIGEKEITPTRGGSG